MIAVDDYDPRRMPNDPWFRQFDDPLRAYSLLPLLVRFFRSESRPAPPDSEPDYVRYAWAVARAQLQAEGGSDAPADLD